MIEQLSLFASEPRPSRPMLAGLSDLIRDAHRAGWRHRRRWMPEYSTWEHRWHRGAHVVGQSVTLGNGYLAAYVDGRHRVGIAACDMTLAQVRMVLATVIPTAEATS